MGFVFVCMYVVYCEYIIVQCEYICLCNKNNRGGSRFCVSTSYNFLQNNHSPMIVQMQHLVRHGIC
jgi:hypothetical protein